MQQVRCCKFWAMMLVASQPTVHRQPLRLTCHMLPGLAHPPFPLCILGYAGLQASFGGVAVQDLVTPSAQNAAPEAAAATAVQSAEQLQQLTGEPSSDCAYHMTH